MSWDWRQDLAKADMGVAFIMLMNIISTVTCVLFNKYLFQTLGFPYATFLTLVHMASNAVFVQITAAFGIVQLKQSDWRKVLPLACSFIGSVVSLNLSLQYNSVGFYQVMKILIVPTLIFMQSTFWNTSFSYPTKLSLVPICIGVGLATASEVSLSTIGLFMAVIGCFTTALHQIWGGTKQKELSLNAMQLLAYQAPLSAIVLIPLVPLCDNVWGPGGLATYEWNSSTVMFIFLSCVAAYGVNITSYLIIGKTSPVTYQVVGHFKTCLVLAGGFMMFDSAIVVKNVIGILIAFVGMIAYTHIKLQENPPPAPKPDDPETGKK